MIGTKQARTNLNGILIKDLILWKLMVASIDFLQKIGLGIGKRIQPKGLDSQ
jgi:hypothetical protein